LTSVATLAAVALEAAGVAGASAGGAPGPVLRWAAPLDAACRTAVCTPILVDDASLVLVSEEGPDGPRVVAMDAADGERRWAIAAPFAASITSIGGWLLVVDRERFVAVDMDTGSITAQGGGRVVGTNEYGTLVVETAIEIAAIDSTDGRRLWSRPADHHVLAVCRDVVVVAPPTDDEPASFDVLEQHTGEVRWSGDVEFDPARDRMVCGGRSLYVARFLSAASLSAWWTFDGWPQWETTIPVARGAVELFRQVAIVHGADAETGAVAIDRETGEVLWRHDSDDLGVAVSSRLRLRRDELGLFVLHPLTGDEVHRLPLAAGVTVAGTNGSRVVVVDGPTVAAYGTHDLGLAWTLPLRRSPDEVDVGDATMVVRLGDEVLLFDVGDDDLFDL
jgi:outer membrane protein assembly factor BamB